MTTDSQWPLWEVFTQGSKGEPFEHAGSVHAADAENALQNARDVYARRGEAVNLWVVPSAAIVASAPGSTEKKTPSSRRRSSSPAARSHQ